MDPFLRGVLDRSLVSICDDLRISRVLEYLQSVHVFQEDHIEEIKAEKLEREKRYRLVSVLKTRGPAAFPAFYNALRLSRQDQLVAALEAHLPPDYAAQLAANCPPQDSVISSSGSSGSLNPASPNPTITFPNSRRGSEATLEGQAGSEASLLPQGEPEELDPQSLAKAEDYYTSLGYTKIQTKPTSGVIEDLPVKVTEDAGPRPAFFRQNAASNNNLPLHYKPETTYRNFSQPKGLCMIFNNKKFLNDVLPMRAGTDVDCRNLTKLFSKLGYTVKVKENHSAREMKAALARFALKDHKEHDSAVVIVLSHGLHGEVYGACGSLVPVTYFTEVLDGNHCQGLLHKPKLFFIQACRGEKYDGGVVAPDGPVLAKAARATGDSAMDPMDIIRELNAKDAADAAEMGQAVAKVPVDSDTLIAYATTPGFVSWRNSARGSWFVQALVEVFSAHAYDEHLLELLTRVNNRVVEAFTANTGHGYKQIPESANRLRKKFFFFPGVQRPRE